MPAKALFLVADGFVDAHVHELSGAMRGQGFDVVFAGGARGGTFTGKSGRPVTAEKGYLDLNLSGYDLLVLPGGECAKAFAEHKSFVNIVYTMLHKGRVVAALGRSTTALIPAQNQKTSPNPAATGTKILKGEILKGRRIASDPDVTEELQEAGGIPVDEPVVVDGPVVSAQGAASIAAIVSAAVPVAWQFRALTH